MNAERSLALFSIVVETPVHIRGGARQGGIAYPLWRAANGNLPAIPGSDLQSAVWEIVQESRPADESMLSGATEGNAAEKLSLVTFKAAEIILFPVRAACGVFAFITSLENLMHLKRFLTSDGGFHWVGLDELSSGQVMVCPGSDLVLKNNVVLEEYRLSASVSPELMVLAEWMAKNLWPSSAEYSFWQAKLRRSLTVLNSEDYRFFVEVNTELRALAVKPGVAVAGEFEECLPQDTVLLSHVLHDAEGSSMARRAVLERFANLGRDFVWLGSGREDGQGLCRIKCLPLEGAQTVEFPLNGA